MFLFSKICQIKPRVKNILIVGTTINGKTFFEAHYKYYCVRLCTNLDQTNASSYNSNFQILWNKIEIGLQNYTFGIIAQKCE